LALILVLLDALATVPPKLRRGNTRANPDDVEPQAAAVWSPPRAIRLAMCSNDWLRSVTPSAPRP